jgi:hypothetical protein
VSKTEEFKTERCVRFASVTTDSDDHEVVGIVMWINGQRFTLLMEPPPAQRSGTLLENCSY